VIPFNLLLQCAKTSIISPSKHYRYVFHANWNSGFVHDGCCNFIPFLLQLQLGQTTQRPDIVCLLSLSSNKSNISFPIKSSWNNDSTANSVTWSNLYNCRKKFIKALKVTVMSVLAQPKQTKHILMSVTQKVSDHQLYYEYQWSCRHTVSLEVDWKKFVPHCC